MFIIKNKSPSFITNITNELSDFVCKFRRISYEADKDIMEEKGEGIQKKAGKNLFFKLNWNECALGIGVFFITCHGYILLLT